MGMGGAHLQLQRMPEGSRVKERIPYVALHSDSQQLQPADLAVTQNPERGSSGSSLHDGGQLGHPLFPCPRAAVPRITTGLFLDKAAGNSRGL